MDNMKVIIVTLIWTFTILVIYMIANTMLFGYIDPTMRAVAYNARDNDSAAAPGGFVNYDRYVARTSILKTSFDISCFILILIPYAYLFVRLLLRKEQTAAPPVIYPGGAW